MVELVFFFSFQLKKYQRNVTANNILLRFR